MEIDYEEMISERALKCARDMVEQRGGPEGCDLFYDSDLGMVRFKFEQGKDYEWAYPDGTKGVHHPDTRDGGLLEDMTDDSQPMCLEIYRCHRFEDPMYGLFNADIVFNDEFAEMESPDAMKEYARAMISVADRLDVMNIEAMKHWRKE